MTLFWFVLYICQVLLTTDKYNPRYWRAAESGWIRLNPLSWGAPQKPGPDRVKDIGFKYEPYLCNGCHDLMEKAMSFDNVAIVYIKGNAYRIHFWYMSKDDATDIMNGSNLIDKIGVL